MADLFFIYLPLSCLDVGWLSGLCTWKLLTLHVSLVFDRNRLPVEDLPVPSLYLIAEVAFPVSENMETNFISFLELYII